MKFSAKTIERVIKLLCWMEDWKPLAFRWLPDRWGLRDDACGCVYCEERRAKGNQGPRKYF